MKGTAHAAGASGAAGGFASFIPLILIFVVFYFLLIRPQQKQAKLHRTFLSELKKGDKVMTKGGVHGVLTGLTESAIRLEIAKEVVIKVSRDAIAGALGKDGAVIPTKKEKKSAGG